MAVVTRDLTLYGDEGVFAFGAPRWEILRRAIVAYDPVFPNDDTGF